MPRVCCVYGCDNSPRRDQTKKQYFRIPTKDQDLCEQWLTAIQQPNLEPSGPRVCSDHFKADDYLVRPNSLHPRLKPSAVPSIFPRPSAAPSVLPRKRPCIMTEVNLEDNGNLVSKHDAISSIDDTGSALPACGSSATQSILPRKRPCIIPEKTEQPSSSVISEDSNRRFITSILNEHLYCSLAEFEIPAPPLVILTVDENNAVNYAVSSTTVSEDENLGTAETSIKNLGTAATSNDVHSAAMPMDVTDTENSVRTYYTVRRNFITYKDPLKTLTPIKAIDALKSRMKSLRLQIKHLQCSIKRREDRLIRMSQDYKLLNDFVKNRLTSTRTDIELRGKAKAVFQNELLNCQKVKCGRRYSEELKDFVITLMKISPKAYDHCRQIFSLPHPKCVLEWISLEKYRVDQI